MKGRSMTMCRGFTPPAGTNLTVNMTDESRASVSSDTVPRNRKPLQQALCPGLKPGRWRASQEAERGCFLPRCPDFLDEASCAASANSAAAQP